MTNLILYTLINPSDPYTFYAPSVEVAGVAVALISTHYGAKPVNGEGESTPVLSGWDAWMQNKGIDEAWILRHTEDIAAALDSFFIGHANDRLEAEATFNALPDDQKHTWRQAQRQTSLNGIGERAYDLAAQLRSADTETTS